MKKLLYAIPITTMLTACTPTQEQQVLQDINLACLGVGIGTTVVIEVATSGSTIGKVAGTVGSDASTVCNTLMTGAQSMIESIISSGGSASVKVLTTSPAGARHAYKMRVVPHV